MKLYLQIIVAFAILAVALSIDPAVRKAMQKCQMKTGAGATDFATISRLPYTPTTQTQFCLLGCLHKAAGAIDESNKYDLSKTLALLDPLKSKDVNLYNKMSAAITTCIEKEASGSDECETAKNVVLCIGEFVKTK